MPLGSQTTASFKLGAQSPNRIYRGATQFFPAAVATLGRSLDGSQYFQADKPSAIRSALQGAPATSHSFWVNRAVGLGGVLLDCRYGSGTSYVFVLSITPDGDVFVGAGTDSSDTRFAGTVTLSTKVPESAWAHVGIQITYGATGEVVVYLDGIEVGSASQAFATDTLDALPQNVVHRDIIFGRGLEVDGFVGDVGPMASFRRALTAQEWTDLANGTDAETLDPAVHFPAYSGWDGVDAGALVGSSGIKMFPAPGTYAPASATEPSVTAPAALDKPAPELMVLRLRAEDASAVGEGNPVDSLSIGNGWSADGSGAARPTYTLEGGLHRLRMTTAQNMVLSGGTFSVTEGLSFVGIFANGDSTGDLWTLRDTNSTSDQFGFDGAEGGLYVDKATRSQQTLTAMPTAATIYSGWMSRHAAADRRDGERIIGTVTNGVALGSGEFRLSEVIPINDYCDFIKVGGGDSSGALVRGWAGDIIDCVWLVGQATEEEVIWWEGKLAHDNGLTANLPAGHPYKTTAPTADSDTRMLGRITPYYRQNWENGYTYPGWPNCIYHEGSPIAVAHSTYLDSISAEPQTIFEKIDGGAKHTNLSVVNGFGTPFVHTDGNIYMFQSRNTAGVGFSIVRSTDGGRTWSAFTRFDGVVTNLPANGAGGLEYTQNPFVNPVYFDGHVFMSLNLVGASQFDDFRQIILYAPDTADLLDPASWSATDRNTLDPTALTTRPSTSRLAGFAETQIVKNDTGIEMWARTILSADRNEALRVPIIWDGTTASWPATWDAAWLVPQPGGHETTALDSRNGNLWGIVAPYDEVIGGLRQRSEVAVISAPLTDTATWTEEAITLSRSEISRGMDQSAAIDWTGVHSYHGELDANGIFHVSARTSMDGAFDLHDNRFLGYFSVDITEFEA